MNEKDFQEFVQNELNNCAENFVAAVKAKMDTLSSTYESWVPVTERLPLKSGRYMVTIKSKAKRRTEMRNFDFASQTWESECWAPENIIAWQERPAPYIPKE